MVLSGEITARIREVLESDGTLVTVQGQGIGISIDGKPAVIVAIRDIPGRPEPDPAMPAGGNT